MNARHLFRYARYALAALACRRLRLGPWHQLSSDLAETRPPHHRGNRTDPDRLLNQPALLFQEVKP